jgi:TRAP-type C4-dicarboxylate transport system permease large subunit
MSATATEEITRDVTRKNRKVFISLGSALGVINGAVLVISVGKVLFLGGDFPWDIVFLTLVVSVVLWVLNRVYLHTDFTAISNEWWFSRVALVLSLLNTVVVIASFWRLMTGKIDEMPLDALLYGALGFVVILLAYYLYKRRRMLREGERVLGRVQELVNEADSQ